MSKPFKIIASVIFLIILLVFGAGFFYWQHLLSFSQTKGSHDVRVEFEILRGASPRTISQQLKNKNLISSAFDFYVYLRFVARKAPKLKAGYYVVHGTYTPDEIIALLQKGLKKEIRFTIPEGANKREIAAIVEASGLASQEEMLKAMENTVLLEEFLKEEGWSLKKAKRIKGGIEGYVFPDTYQFPPGTKGEEILRKMNQRMLSMFDEAMKKRMKEMNWSLHKVLTMASIVEKESADPTERAMIASVFFNRLKKRMKLQTDPTVIYGIKNYEGNIKKKHLLQFHLYNTYTNFGLPPGPIASPGLESIKAVLWPADTNYLYFVSRNDKTHVFCATYTCHQKAVKIWQVDFFKNQAKILP